ncbi:MAG: hypothetical protein SO065_04255 [Lawsonibacter sp.]|nr:hypothetical protein [Lawsonibacter sp.]
MNQKNHFSEGRILGAERERGKHGGEKGKKGKFRKKNERNIYD